MSREIFIELSPHKTGTTFRQMILYPKMDVHYSNNRILDTILFEDFDKPIKYLISNENFTGWSYLPEHDAVKERRNTVSNLKKLFPNAKIIICKREKNSWINSLYKQYIWAGGKKKFDQWYNSIDEAVFDIEKYISHIKKHFDDVLVLDFSLMKKDIFAFSKEICNYIGIELPIFENKKLNTSLSNKKMNLLRISNHVWKTHENHYGLPFFKFWRAFLYKISIKDHTGKI